LKEISGVPIWTQDLYGTQRQYLGPVHGFAGNMIPLIRGWSWLTEDQRARITDLARRTLSAHAHRSDLGVSWRAAVDGKNLYCQHCHGAPGIVTTFADAPFTSPELEELLIGGGKLGGSPRAPISVMAQAAMAMRVSSCNGEQAMRCGSNAPEHSP